MIQPTCIFIMW